MVEEDKIFKQFKEHSVAEFFKKNQQMLGFSGKVRSLTTVVHEFVTNAIDAAEEAGILPEIEVHLEELGSEHYRLTIKDNGPGIPKSHVGKALGQMLAGTKFHRYVQQRGQQGIGACMSGDTLIPLCDGRLLPIKDIVQKNMVNEYITAVDQESLRLKKAKIIKCWKVKNPKFIKVKTQRGRVIKLTPENPVLTIKGGRVQWIEASELKEGMRIAAPRKTLSSCGKKIRTIDLFDYKDIQADASTLLKDIEKKVLDKYGGLDTASKRLKISKDVLRNWFRRKMENGKPRGRPTVADLLRISKDVGFSNEEIISRISRIGRNGTFMNIPEYIDEEIAWLAGLIVGDGNLTSEKADKWGVGISLSGNDINLISKFTSLLTKKFGLKVRTHYIEKEHYYMTHTCSVLLSEILNKFGVIRGNKSKTFDLTDFLFSMDDKILAAYLKGIFDAEGSVAVDRHAIAFHIRNKKATEKIFHALLRLGIYASTNKLREYTRLLITEKENVKRYIEKIGFSSDKKLRDALRIANVEGINSVTEMIPDIAGLSEVYTRTLNYPLTELPSTAYSAVMKKQDMSKYALKKLIHKFGSKNEIGEYLSTLAENDVVWLKVTDLKEEENEERYVYDLEIEGHHNFVANGLITHNSGCCMFSYMTTGQPTKAISHFKGRKYEIEVLMDFKKNRPILNGLSEEATEEHGLTVISEFKGVKHEKSNKGMFEYLRRTALANPHVTITFTDPAGERNTFPRSIEQIPPKPKEIKPHPLGISAHDLLEFANHSTYSRISSFLQNDFTRVSAAKVNELRAIVEEVDFNKKPSKLSWDDAEKIVKSFDQVKWIAPATDSLVPIGAEQIEASFNNIFSPDLLMVSGRSPRVYKGGIPFMVEVGIAFGGGVKSAGKTGEIMRFANKVPLLFDTSGCAITSTIKSIDWKRYNLKNFDDEPIVVLVNMISVHVPYTGAGKQAIADEEEIEAEIKFAVMEAARGIQKYLAGKRKANEIATKKKVVSRYVEQISADLADLTGRSKDRIKKELNEMIEKKYERAGSKEEEEERETQQTKLETGNGDLEGEEE
jgi:DNA topoisomerase-6 subunit B